MIEFLGETCEEQLVHAKEIVARYRYDELTTLKRRFDFNDDFKKMVHSRIHDGIDFTFALIDINNLKTTNDKYGYLAGDELIKDVAKNLKDTFQGQATVYRIGGDEFAILCDTLNRKEIKKMLKEADTAEKYCFGIVDSNEFDWNGTNCRDVFNFANNILMDVKAEKNINLKRNSEKNY